MFPFAVQRSQNIEGGGDIHAHSVTHSEALELTLEAKQACDFHDSAVELLVIHTDHPGIHGTADVQNVVVNQHEVINRKI